LKNIEVKSPAGMREMLLVLNPSFKKEQQSYHAKKATAAATVHFHSLKRFISVLYTPFLTIIN